MKKLFAIICLLSCTVVSCKKDKHDDRMNYNVNGIADFTLSNTSPSYLPLTIEYISGQQEQVSISVVDLPLGVTADISSKSGTPTFYSMITFNVDSNTVPSAGTHAIKIKTTTASGLSKELPCNISMAGTCQETVMGDYVGVDEEKLTYTVKVSASPNKNKVILQLSDLDIVMILDCVHKTVTVPIQMFNTFSNTTVSGDGTFDGSHMNISFLLIDDHGATEKTTINFTRK